MDKYNFDYLFFTKALSPNIFLAFSIDLRHVVAAAVFADAVLALAECNVVAHFESPFSASAMRASAQLRDILTKSLIS